MFLDCFLVFGGIVPVGAIPPRKWGLRLFKQSPTPDDFGGGLRGGALRIGLDNLFLLHHDYNLLRFVNNQFIKYSSCRKSKFRLTYFPGSPPANAQIERRGRGAYLLSRSAGDRSNGREREGYFPSLTFFRKGIF
jgi:hypothetical protein